MRRMRKIQIPAMTPIGRSQPKIRSRTRVDSIRPENSTLWASSSRRSAASSAPGMRTATKRTPGVHPVRRASHCGAGAGASAIGSLRTPRISRSPKETRATRSLADPLHQAADRDLLGLGREEPALEEDQHDHRAPRRRGRRTGLAGGRGASSKDYRRKMLAEGLEPCQTGRRRRDGRASASPGLGAASRRSPPRAVLPPAEAPPRSSGRLPVVARGTPQAAGWSGAGHDQRRRRPVGSPTSDGVQSRRRRVYARSNGQSATADTP